VDPDDDRTGEATVTLAVPPVIAPLALRAAGRPGRPVPETPSTVTSPAEAMRHEEIARTRLFIAMGWLISVIAAIAVAFVHAPPVLSILLVGGLGIGVVLSVFTYRRLADPANFTERELLRLGLICVVNGHIAVTFFGVYSAAPVVIGVGIHFVSRTELARVGYTVFVTSVVCYAAIAGAIVCGIVDDPGVFASDHPLPRVTAIAATLFVLATYVLAYHSALTVRQASLRAIEQLQHATRLASKREALMEELRADLEHALRVGGPGRYTDQVIGDYRLGIVLGRGAIGEVYAATHVDTGAPAAVKVLRREQLSDRTQLARFTREIRAVMAIDSPHVVRVLAASEADAAVPHLAMELLHGRTLGEQLRDGPRLAFDATRELVRQVADGIDAARAAGIVHRDLKPQNLLETSDGTWKILDFGVAALLDDGNGSLTRGEAVGTPQYMSPEQAQGHAVDHRADLYALAAITYRCLTGHYATPGQSDVPALLYAVVHRMPRRPSALAELPADVDRWFALALAKAPGDRFSSGTELAAEFADAVQGRLAPSLRRRADALVERSPWEAT
jgi:serine/threonine-protein kinase